MRPALIISLILLASLSFGQQKPTIQDRPRNTVTIDKDSVQAIVKILDIQISEHKQFLDRVPQAQKELAELEAFKRGFLLPFSDSTFIVRKTK